jgi:hypothetical protein
MQSIVRPKFSLIIVDNQTINLQRLRYIPSPTRISYPSIDIARRQESGQGKDFYGQVNPPGKANLKAAFLWNEIL